MAWAVEVPLMLPLKLADTPFPLHRAVRPVHGRRRGGLFGPRGLTVGYEKLTFA